MMLQTVDWVQTGIIDDADYPDLSMQKINMFGTRESIPLPLSTPVAILGGISAAVIWWDWNKLDGTEIMVLIKLDGEEWREVENGEKIPSINPNCDYSKRTLSVKLVLTSTITEIDPGQCPELDELVIAFYHSAQTKWDTGHQVKLAWKE
jgi:hypothetical protein